MTQANQETEYLFSNIRSKADVIAASEKIKSEKQVLNYISRNGKFSIYASWSLRTHAQNHPGEVHGYLKQVIEVIEDDLLPGPVLRNLSGLLCDHAIPENLENRITIIAFKILSNHKHPVAVHSNALQLIKKICRKYPELNTELNLVMERHPFKDSASIKAHLKSTVKKAFAL